VKIDKAINF